MANPEFKSKNQIVYEMMRDAIISGEFEPGSRIVIDELALQYGISHSPIRECLRLLEGDGLVTIQPYTGVTVTELKPELIVEVFTLLESLEIISSCRASNRASKKQLDKLAKIIDDMQQYTRSSHEWSVQNIRFHMIICDIADMSITRNMMKRTLYHWDRLRRYYLEEVSARRIPQAQQEHQELLQAIRSGDEQRIIEVIRRHNKAAMDDYLSYIKATQQIDLYAAYPYG